MGADHSDKRMYRFDAHIVLRLLTIINGSGRRGLNEYWSKIWIDRRE